MQLKHIETKLISGLYRNAAVFESKAGKRYTIHYTMEWQPDPNCHHFFLMGAIFSYLLGEPYRQQQAVDATLLRNVRSILKQWQQWLGREAIDIDAPEAASPSRSVTGERGHASFFSGGIDSLFTDIDLGSQLTHLVSVGHSSTDAREITEVFAKWRHVTPYVECTGRKHIIVATNHMTEMPEMLDAYAFLTHSGALAAVGHFLSSTIRRAEISSTHAYGKLIMWGSHPLIDPLYSSRDFEVSHFGAQYTRVEKTERIGLSHDALRVLNVCSLGHEGSLRNCSRCQKCLRTMVTLDLLGIGREQAVTFDWSRYEPQKFAALFLRTRNDIAFAREIEQAARSKGRNDIARAVESAIRTSKRFVPITETEMYLRRRWPQVVKHKRELIWLRDALYRPFGLRKVLE